MTTRPASEDILRGVLDQWQDAVDAHEHGRVASYFTEDAIFQGLHPYSVGRRALSRVPAAGRRLAAGREMSRAARSAAWPAPNT